LPGLIPKDKPWQRKSQGQQFFPFLSLPILVSSNQVKQKMIAPHDLFQNLMYYTLRQVVIDSQQHVNGETK